MVEFAIVLPIFLLLIGGMVDLGRAFYTQVMLTNAAREGARTAMYSPTNLQSAVQQRAWAAAGCDSTQCDDSHPVVIENPCATSTSNVTVTVTDSNFQWILIKPAMALFGTNLAEPNIEGKATMQCGG